MQDSFQNDYSTLNCPWRSYSHLCAGWKLRSHHMGLCRQELHLCRRRDKAWRFPSSSALLFSIIPFLSRQIWNILYIIIDFKIRTDLIFQLAVITAKGFLPQKTTLRWRSVALHRHNKKLSSSKISETDANISIIKCLIRMEKNCFCPLKLKDSHSLSFHCALQLCCSSLQGTSVRCLQYLCLQEAE